MRTIGILCIGAGCCGVGLTAFWRLCARVQILTAFVTLCDRLAAEITFRLTPLPELAARLETPALAAFWRGIDYTPYNDDTYADAWRRQAETLDLPRTDKALIGELGLVLGQYDAENQTRSIRLLRDQLCISLDTAREARTGRGKVCILSGLIAGLFLVVVFV